MQGRNIRAMTWTLRDRMKVLGACDDDKGAVMQRVDKEHVESEMDMIRQEKRIYAKGNSVSQYKPADAKSRQAY